MKTEFITKVIRKGKHFCIIKTTSLISGTYWFTLSRLGILQKMFNLSPSLFFDEVSIFYGDTPDEAIEAMNKMEKYYSREGGKK